MHRRLSIAILLAAILAAMTPPAPASAQTSPNLAGRNVQLIIGFGTGGGYDLLGRAVGRHLCLPPGRIGLLAVGVDAEVLLVPASQRCRIARAHEDAADARHPLHRAILRQRLGAQAVVAFDFFGFGTFGGSVRT